MSPRRTWCPRASRSAASTAVFAPTWVRSTTAASPDPGLERHLVDRGPAADEVAEPVAVGEAVAGHRYAARAERVRRVLEVREDGHLRLPADVGPDRQREVDDGHAQPPRPTARWRATSAGVRRSTGSPAAISPGTRTRAYTRLHPGCRFWDTREYAPSRNAARTFTQGLVKRVIWTSTSSPSRKKSSGWTVAQSSPASVRFSPSAPGSTGWPSAWSASICSTEKRQSARSGPP